MNDSNLFYQESGQINILGLTLSFLICIPIALILGYAYSVVIMFIPLIYFNFLITVGLGLALGLIVRLIVRLTKNRNKKSKLILAFTLGLLTYYFQWTVFMLHAYDGEIPGFTYYLANLHWLINPMNLIDFIVKVNGVGFWSIIGAPVTGLALSLVWIIEAFFIISGPIVAIFKTKVYPYSELQNKWYPKYTLLKDFDSAYTNEKMISHLQKDSFKTIQELNYSSGLWYTKIYLFYLKDEENQYLTFEDFSNEAEGKESSEIMINNFEIDKKAAEQILDNFENKKERIELF